MAPLEEEEEEEEEEEGNHRVVCVCACHYVYQCVVITVIVMLKVEAGCNSRSEVDDALGDPRRSVEGWQQTLGYLHRLV